MMRCIMTNPKDEIGAKKVNLDVVPDTGVLYSAMALMEGARKYGSYNWRTNPVQANIYVAAARRHLAQWWNGEDTDVSGAPHLGCAIASLMILVDATEVGNLVDNRPPAKNITCTMDKLLKDFIPKS